MRGLLSCLIWVAACGAAAAGSTPQGIQAISAYAGTWKSDVSHLDTPYSKESHETTTLVNDCWRSGEFYTCHQSVDGKSMALVVFVFDAKSGAYTTYPIAPGATSVPPGKLVIAGNVWTFPWQTTQDGKQVWFRVVNVFIAPGAIEFRQEYSEDQIQWHPMASGHERRITPSH